MTNNTPDYEDNLVFLQNEEKQDDKDKIIEELKEEIKKLKLENDFMKHELNQLDN